MFLAKSKLLSVFTISIWIINILLLQSCTYKHGDEAIRHTSIEELKKMLVPDETTKEMVLSTFGPPSSIGASSDGAETWTYSYGEAKQSGVAYVPIVGLFAPPPTSTGKTISIFFNKNDTVKSYTMGGAVGQSGKWE